MYQCPKCKSNNIKITARDITCLSCGYTETMYDYAMSWDCWREICVSHGEPDPGSNITQEITVAPCLAEPKEWDKRQWYKVQQLEGLVKHLQNKINEHIDKSRQFEGDYV